MSTDLSKPEPSEIQLRIEKEKTRRQLLQYGIMAIVALIIAIFFLKDDPTKPGQTKKFEISTSGIKIENSLVQQAVDKKDISTMEYNDGKSEVQVSVGDVSKDMIQQLQSQKVSVSPNKFTGNNYVNNIEGYIIPVYDSKKFSLAYNSDWAQDPTGTSFISQIMANDGGVVEARMAIDNTGMSIKTATESILAPIFAFISGNIPEIKYDFANNTSFLAVYNQTNAKNVVFKLVKRGNRLYSFVARYDPGSPYEGELLQMVADATLIEQ